MTRRYTISTTTVLKYYPRAPRNHFNRRTDITMQTHVLLVALRNSDTMDKKCPPTPIYPSLYNIIRWLPLSNASEKSDMPTIRAYELRRKKQTVSIQKVTLLPSHDFFKYLWQDRRNGDRPLVYNIRGGRFLWHWDSIG